MAKKKAETTVEEKLRALYNLQLVDTRIDEIRNVRGELPLEVEDLDAEVAGLEKRLNNLGVEVTAYEKEIKTKKSGIDTLKNSSKSTLSSKKAFATIANTNL